MKLRDLMNILEKLEKSKNILNENADIIIPIGNNEYLDIKDIEIENMDTVLLLPEEEE